MNTAVSVGAPAFCLAFSDLLGQRQILCREIHALNVAVISASGYTKETAHFADAILFPVTIDDLVFNADLHSFPVSERKSRSSSFSIFKRIFSFL